VKKELSLSKIEEAEQQLAVAEEELGAAIHHLRAPRAEKTVSATIEDALDKLRLSRAKLKELRALIAASDDT
jgi:hypothetical protein